MNYEEIKIYLYDLIHYGNTYGIDRMRLLSQLLGNPENDFPIIHVAGTNGKGSVCAMLEAIFRENGYKTGLFTSPHLIQLEERIQVNREIIAKEEFITLIHSIKDLINHSFYPDKSLLPSFFEIINAAGFLYFSKKKVDIAIIETGLGGRYDSTNIVNPLLSIITSISRDHMEILGNDLESITLAKSGIIKPEKPVVIGLLDPKVESIIRQIAKENRAPVFSVKEAFGENIEKYPKTNLEGPHQNKNAAIALLASQTLINDFLLDPQKSISALQKVNWPGRWQVIHFKKLKFILDCAHNEAGAEALKENLKKLIKQENKKPIIIFGTLGISRAHSLIPCIVDFAQDIILIKPQSPKALDTHLLEKLIPTEFKGKIIHSSIKELFETDFLLKYTLKKSTILATGSTYLVGEILENLSSG